MTTPERTRRLTDDEVRQACWDAGAAEARRLCDAGMVPPARFYALLAAVVRADRLRQREQKEASRGPA